MGRKKKKTFRNSELSLDAFHAAAAGRNGLSQLKPKLETDPDRSLQVALWQVAEREGGC